MENRVNIHQTTYPVGMIVAGLSGVCYFDEETQYYYPVPKEYFAIFIEQYTPGAKVSADLTVTVKANTTTGSKSITAAEGMVYYLESIAFGSFTVTGTYTLKVDDVTVVENGTLTSGSTLNIVNLFGNRFRCGKIEIIVTLSTAPGSDTNIPVTATVITKAQAF